MHRRHLLQFGLLGPLLVLAAPPIPPIRLVERDGWLLRTEDR